MSVLTSSTLSAVVPRESRGQLAVNWALVDLTVSERRFSNVVGERALAAAGDIRRGPASEAVELGPLWREEFDGGFAYPNVRVELDRDAGTAALTIVGPPNHECFAPEPGPKRLRSHWWPLAVCRELDDALLMLRSHRPGVRSLVLRTEGDPLAVASADVALTSGYEHDWFVREVVLYWKRTLKRLDLAWQSVFALVEPGSCFVGTLFELAFAAHRIFIVDGTARDGPEGPPAELFLTGMKSAPFPRRAASPDWNRGSSAGAITSPGAWVIPSAPPDAASCREQSGGNRRSHDRPGRDCRAVANGPRSEGLRSPAQGKGPKALSESGPPPLMAETRLRHAAKGTGAGGGCASRRAVQQFRGA